MRDTFKLLAERRRIGRERPEIGPGFRSLVHGNHTIFYRLGDTHLEVLRVLHHRQNVAVAFGLSRGDPGLGGS
jgi:toxin ParE1/3/4